MSFIEFILNEKPFDPIICLYLIWFTDTRCYIHQLYTLFSLRRAELNIGRQSEQLPLSFTTTRPSHRRHDDPPDGPATARPDWFASEGYKIHRSSHNPHLKKKKKGGSKNAFYMEVDGEIKHKIAELGDVWSGGFRGFRDGERPQTKVAHASVLLMHAGGYRSLGENYYHHSDSPGGKKVIITPTTKTIHYCSVVAHEGRKNMFTHYLHTNSYILSIVRYYMQHLPEYVSYLSRSSIPFYL